MAVEPVEKLLAAERFVPFVLHFGSMDEVTVEAAVECRVDRLHRLLYLKNEIIDLRLVTRITIGSD